MIKKLTIIIVISISIYFTIKLYLVRKCVAPPIFKTWISNNKLWGSYVLDINLSSYKFYQGDDILFCINFSHHVKRIELDSAIFTSDFKKYKIPFLNRFFGVSYAKVKILNPIPAGVYDIKVKVNTNYLYSDVLDSWFKEHFIENVEVEILQS